jgi:NitT/TauT family transport system permease protein
VTAKRKPLLARPNLARIIAPLATGLAFLCLWQIGCRLSHVPVYLVPAPTDIARTLNAEAATLFLALLMTLKVTVLAFGASIVVGVLFAVLMVQSRVIEASLLPYAILLQVTPVVAVAPLIIVWVKDTTVALVLCAMMVAIFPIISNTILGLRSVPPSLRDLFQIYGANRWQTLIRLRIPAALPFFFGGLRISSGLSLIGAVVAEFVAGTGGANAGLAYQILLAGMQLNIPLMFAALVLIALFGVLQFLLMVWLTRLVMRRWHDVEAI